MGGGGGDDGYAQKQQAIEDKKAAARASLNAAFGVAAPAPAARAPSLPSRVAGQMFSDVGDPYEAPASSLSDEAAKNKAARDTLYSTVRDNAFTAGKRGFDERKTDATRNNKFALFAQGLQGGSVDVDENALIDRTYKQGLLDLGGKADAAKADLRGNDEQTRLQLLQSIDAGMDEGSALSSALGQLQSNGERAYAGAQGTSIGDLFADSGLLYTKSQAARGRQQAMDVDKYGLFSRGAPRNQGASGVISTVGV